MTKETSLKALLGAGLMLVLSACASTPYQSGEVSDPLEPMNRAWMELGRGYSAADYLRAISLMHALARRVGAFLERHDLILTPTLGQPSLKLGTVDTSGQDIDGHISLLFETIAPHTALFNQTGGAAMSVPLHRTKDGLPVGVQFAGRLGDEPKLIRLAAQLEEAQPWFGKRPATFQ